MPVFHKQYYYVVDENYADWLHEKSFRRQQRVDKPKAMSDEARLNQKCSILGKVDDQTVDDHPTHSRCHHEHVVIHEREMSYEMNSNNPNDGNFLARLYEEHVDVHWWFRCFQTPKQ